jgi:hypothetical protein
VLFERLNVGIEPVTGEVMIILPYQSNGIGRAVAAAYVEENIH